jgi:hypothetical protein
MDESNEKLLREQDFLNELREVCAFHGYLIEGLVMKLTPQEEMIFVAGNYQINENNELRYIAE